MRTGSRTPVSYTHLDVYKRQEKGKVHIFDPNFFVLECDSETDLPGELKEAFLTIDHRYHVNKVAQQYDGMMLGFDLQK